MDGVVEEHVQIGQWQVRLLRPADSERLLSEEAFAADEFLPYWAELWPSGVALARHVATLDLAGKVVLELGCGLGLPSLAAARGGASVVATDWTPAALALLERNARANAVALETTLLRWDSPGPLAARSFDCVLAADVLYEERNARPLLDLLPQVVSPGGEAIVADPGRRHAAAFFEHAALAWEIGLVAEPSLPGGGLYRLRRAHG